MSTPTILRPCPFCGEREHLTAGHSIERPIVEGGDTKKLPSGFEAFEEVDAVYCQVCEAMAPLDVWNGERPASDYAVLRDFFTPATQVAA